MPFEDSPVTSELRPSVQTGRTAPIDCTIVETFDRRAAEDEDAAAVVQEDRVTSFAELREMSQRAAAGLSDAGIRSGDRVGVYCRRSPGMIAAVLGIWRCGAIYVPLDPKYPSQRLEAIIAAAEPKLIVCDEQPPHRRREDERLPGMRVDALCRFGSRPKFKPMPARLGDRAVVLYTSGSTGTPKGAVLTHANLANHQTFVIREYALGPADRRTAVCSINFDASLEEIFCTLNAGAALVLPDDGVLDSFERLLRFVDEQRITALFLPTSLWREVTNYLYDERRKFPRTLRLIDVGGERVTRPIYDRFLKVGGDRIRWINVYGPTECSIYATIYEHDPAVDAHRPDEPPIGRPLDNVELYVLDEQGRVVPFGAAGELYIGGAGVGQGYLGRDDLTRERYVERPSDDVPAGRYYRTGDQVRFRDDGNLEYLGRLDDQIKLRGFRIEPGEIESTLLLHPTVRDAAVVVRTSSLNTEYLAAYVVLRPGASWDEGALRQFAAARLPEYMVPRAFVQLDALPLSPNGKIARAALPEPFLDETAAARASLRATREATPLERRIRDAWCEALHLDAVDLDDDFFALGGNSLRAMALIAKLEAALSRSISATTLYQAPTVARLAAAIDAGRDDDASPAVLLRDGDRARPLFFVHPLAGDVWIYRELAARLSTDAAIYGLQLPDRDDAAELDDAVRCAASYVELLRTMQPLGPYRLAGYSSGGMLAYEMARQLAAAGKQIEFLGFLDAGAPPTLERQLTATIGGRLRTALRLVPRALGDLRRQGVVEFGKRIAKFIERRRRGGFAGESTTTSAGEIGESQFLGCFAEDISFFPARRLRQMQRHTQAIFRYEPGSYTGRAQLFRVGRQPLSAVPTKTLGWEHLIDGPVDVYEIAGTHESMMRAPDVDVLAAAMSRALNVASR